MKTILFSLSLLIASSTFSNITAHASQGAISDNDPVAATETANHGPETITQRLPIAPETVGASSDYYCEYQQYCFVNMYGYYICQWRYICM